MNEDQLTSQAAAIADKVIQEFQIASVFMPIEIRAELCQYLSGVFHRLHLAAKEDLQ